MGAKLFTAILFCTPKFVFGLLATLIITGFLGVIATAFTTQTPLNGWRSLIETKDIWHSLFLTVYSGTVALCIALYLNSRILGFFLVSQARGLRGLITPILAAPHAACTAGILFLLAPSGWFSRVIHAFFGIWDRPPELHLIMDPYAFGLIFSLVIKEVPFLLFVSLAALRNIKAREMFIIGSSLGYSRQDTWRKLIFPQLVPLIRLPIFVVYAFSLSVVDIAEMIGPDLPPPFAGLIFEWFYHPSDPAALNTASAGALILCALMLLCMGGLVVMQRMCNRLRGPSWSNGRRQREANVGLGRTLIGFTRVSYILSIGGIFWGAMLALLIWSFAKSWYYPDLLPSRWSLNNWVRQLPQLGEAAYNTLIIGLASSALGLVFAALSLEYRDLRGGSENQYIQRFLYLPLFLPQIGFLFGSQVLLVYLNLDGGYFAVILLHLVFVFPYVYLCLEGPYSDFDQRYTRIAQSLGKGHFTCFMRIKVPLLLLPMLSAMAVGFAVSVAQYLPTLFAGGGRITTLTTEVVSLASGSNRKLLGVLSLVQSLLPMLFFSLTPLLSRVLRRKYNTPPQVSTYLSKKYIKMLFFIKKNYK